MLGYLSILGCKDQIRLHQEYTSQSIICNMQRLQAFKYELMPNGAQRRQMRRFAGCCRFVFNRALALQRTTYEAVTRRSRGYPADLPALIARLNVNRDADMPVQWRCGTGARRARLKLWR
jgi:hypothetical protein